MLIKAAQGNHATKPRWPYLGKLYIAQSTDVINGSLRWLIAVIRQWINHYLDARTPYCRLHFLDEFIVYKLPTNRFLWRAHATLGESLWKTDFRLAPAVSPLRAQPAVHTLNRPVRLQDEARLDTGLHWAPPYPDR